MQLLDGSECDRRAGIRDDGHSEGLAIFNLSAELLTIELEVWDALFGGLSNELLTSQAKQLGGFSTRYFSLPIEFEDDQLARRLFHRAVQIFKEINKVLIEFDLDRSHGINLDSYFTPRQAVDSSGG